MRTIIIEGYSPDEILALPDDQLDAFVLSARPIVFRAGTAEILSEFKVRGESLIVVDVEGIGRPTTKFKRSFENGFVLIRSGSYLKAKVCLLVLTQLVLSSMTTEPTSEKSIHCFGKNPNHSVVVALAFVN